MLNTHSCFAQQRHHTMSLQTVSLGPNHIQTPGDIRHIAAQIEGQYVTEELKHVRTHERLEVIAIRLGALQTKAHPLFVSLGDSFGAVVIADDLERVGIERNIGPIAGFVLRQMFELREGSGSQ